MQHNTDKAIIRVHHVGCREMKAVQWFWCFSVQRNGRDVGTAKFVLHKHWKYLDNT